jgi:hypothetical protein
MEGVGTSTAGFVGLAVKGPVGGVPQLVTGVADFRRKYGGYLSGVDFGDYRFLAYAVEHFFINGGTRAFISRVAPGDAQTAEAQGDSPLKLYASSAGMWGNDIKAVVTPASKAKTNIKKLLSDTRAEVNNSAGFFAGDVVLLTDGDVKKYNRVVKAQDNVVEFAEAVDEAFVDDNRVPSKFVSTCEFNLDVYHDDTAENYGNLSFNINTPHYAAKRVVRSDLIRVEVGELQEDAVHPFELIAGEDVKNFSFNFAGGFNGTAGSVSSNTFCGEDKGPGKRTGIKAFLDNAVCSIMAVPGITDPNVQLSLVEHCETLASRFAVLDVPKELSKTDEVIAHREIFNTQYAALYHPWLSVYDSLDQKNIFIPPSGSVIGIYARSDAARGVHKAPANEVVRACTGLSVSYGKGEQDILNPVGVNLIRSFPGQGINVWGARTASSNGLWKYVNVRRLFIFVEESIKANTNWVVFEPNDETLWARVQRTIEVFLTDLWRSGALAGSSSGEAFYVQVGRSTMSQGDIDSGRLICVIGIAPVKPAEFVIFRLTQKTATE